MSRKRYFLLFSTAVLSFPLYTSAVAHSSQAELTNIITINQAGNPKENNQIIAIILQDKQKQPMRKAGGDQNSPKTQHKSSPKGSGPGPQMLNPQPEPPNRQPPPDRK
jgi:hypothetical protein